MTETDREQRIQQIRQLVECGEYQIDPARVAASLVEEHLTAGEVLPEPEPEKPAEPLASANVAG